MNFIFLCLHFCIVEKGAVQTLWNNVKLLNKQEHWEVRNLKESAHMLGYKEPLSRPSIEIKMILELLIKKKRQFSAAITKEKASVGSVKPEKQQ